MERDRRKESARRKRNRRETKEGEKEMTKGR